MLLIFGLTVRGRPMEAGRFHCPNEGGDRTYTLREMRRYFTVFFLPLVPVKSLGHVVECDSCHAQYGEITLRMPTSKTIEQRIEVGARSLLGAIAASDSHLEDAAVRELEVFLGSPTHCASDLASLGRIQTEGQRTEALAEAGALLDPVGRESLLMAAARASVVDGRIGDRQRSLITAAGTALGMTAAHIEGVLVIAARAAV